MTTEVGAIGAGLAVWAAAGGRRRGSRRLRLAPAAATRRVLLVPLGGLAAWVLCAAGIPPIALLVAATAGAVARQLFRRRWRRAARALRDTDAVVLCFALAAEVRAGRSPADALTTTATQLRALGAGVAAAGRAVGHGAAVHEELQALAAAEACPRLLPVAAVWAASAATGARCADVLDRVGRALAHDDEAAAELDALCAGPRATAWVLCVLPVFGVVLGTAIGASPLPVLLHTTLGGALAAGAVALDLCGVAWVRRITAAAIAR